jgi:hypothetical protein
MRSEEGEGGLYIVPPLGGVGLQRRIASFGYHPCWSPDNKQVLFNTSRYGQNRAYIVNLDGSQPREILAQFMAQHEGSFAAFAWYPDGRSVSVLFHDDPGIWIAPLGGGAVVKLANSPEVTALLSDMALGGMRESWQEPSVSSSWARSGRAVYFSRAFRGTVNVWRFRVDPKAMRAAALERLTMGQGSDGEPEVSSDGRMLSAALCTLTNEVDWIAVEQFVSAGVVEKNGHQISDFGAATFRQRQASKPRLNLYCSDLSQFVVPPVRKNPAVQIRLVSLLG